MSDSASLPVNSAESRMAQAADEFLDRVTRGEWPDVEEFARRYPDIAGPIREMFPALQLMHRPLASGPADQRPDEAGPGVECLGDFQIIREIGRGGMGIVYEALQRSLNRRVALKVLPFASALDPRWLQRFKNEAQAAAHLHHTHIVPVFGVGCERGIHYYAMQYIEGQTLAAVIAQLRRLARGIPAVTPDTDDSDPTGLDLRVANSDLLPGLGPSTDRTWTTPAYVRTAATLAMQAADGLEHAHQMGVIHRDVKPANLMVDVHGQLWITDFGLAHVQSDQRLTFTGDLVGTLRYMSPEQALGGGEPIDCRSDVYSLGATLYELLTLGPVVSGANRQEVLRRIVGEEPLPPRRLNRAVPPELETIVLKALAKAPAERYASAQEMADDLGRFLRDEPIRARRPSLGRRLVKWARRHQPLVITTLASAFAALIMSVVVLALSNQQIRAKQQETDEALAGQQEANARLQRQVYHHKFALAERDWQASQLDQTEHLLDQCPPEERHWEWHYLRRLCRSEVLTLHGHSVVTRVTFRPDGRRLASADDSGIIKIWEMPADRALGQTGGRPVLAIPAHQGAVYALAYSLDGRLLASGGVRDHLIKVWEADTGREVASLDGKPGSVLGLSFAPGGQRLASAHQDQAIRVWELPSGQLVHTLLGHTGPVHSVNFILSDQRLVSIAGDRTIRYWDLVTGQATRSIPYSHTNVQAAAFSVKTMRAATLGTDQTVMLWDAALGRQLFTLAGHTEVLAHCQFSPDGRLLATSSADRTIRLWNTMTGRPVQVLRGHRRVVRGLAFSPDGQLLAAGGQDGTVRVWDCRHDQRSLPLALPTGGRQVVWSASFTADGDRVIGLVDRYERQGPKDVLVSQQPVLWSPATGQELGRLPPFDHRTTLAFSPEGKAVAVQRLTEDTLQVVDLFTRRELFRAPGPKAPRVTTALSPGGRWLAMAAPQGPMRVWDTTTGQEQDLEDPSCGHGQMAFSSDGTFLVGSGPEHEVKLWDMATGRLRSTLRGHAGFVAALAFHPHRPLLASASADQTVRLWTLDTDEPARVLRGHVQRVNCLAFSPDGRRLASGGNDAVLLIWDVESGLEVLTLRGHVEGATDVVFSPDGSRLLSLESRHPPRIWDGRPWDGPTP